MTHFDKMENLRSVQTRLFLAIVTRSADYGHEGQTQIGIFLANNEDEARNQVRNALSCHNNNAEITICAVGELGEVCTTPVED